MINSGMNASLFKVHIRRLKRWEEDAKESGTKCKERMQNFADAGYEMYSTFQHLASIDSDLHKGLQPNLDSKVAEDEEYTKAFSSIKESVCRVEFMWNGRVDLLFFPKPKEAKALSDASKNELVANIDMETAESLKTDFLDRSLDLVAEMKHLAYYSQVRTLVFAYFVVAFSRARRFTHHPYHHPFFVSSFSPYLLSFACSSAGSTGYRITWARFACCPSPWRCS